MSPHQERSYRQGQGESTKKSSSKKKKKKKKGSPSSSSSYSDSSYSSTDSSSDSDGSSSDGKKKKSKKKKSQKDDNNNKSLAKAKSKGRKEIKIQKLTQSMEEAQKGMLDMVRGLGLPEAIQKQFEEQQLEAKSNGKDKGKAEPLLKMLQWKELLEANKKASSLPPTPAKAGLFTAACEKVKATPR